MKKLFVLLNIAISLQLNAQQQPLLGASIYNPHFMNFAFAGTNEVAQIDILSRMHWVGYENNPTTFLANGFVTLSKNKGQFSADKSFFASPERTVGVFKHVIGGTILHDRAGLINHTALRFNYAIHLPITKNWMVSASLGAGYGHLFFNGNNARMNDNTDAVAMHNLQTNQSVPATTAGIAIYTKQLSLGLGIEQMIKSNINFNELTPKSTYNPHFTAYAAYEIGSGAFRVTPQVNYRFTADVKGIADFGAQFKYNQAVWLGLYGRSSKSMAVQIGANLFKGAYLAYGIDLPVGRLSNARTTSHEIRLGIFLGKKQKETVKHEPVKESSTKRKVKENVNNKFADEDAVE